VRLGERGGDRNVDRAGLRDPAASLKLCEVERDPNLLTGEDSERSESVRRVPYDAAVRRPITAAEYIRDRVQVSPSGCWNWTGYRNGDGYAIGHHRGRWVRAYRFSYEVFVGPITGGLTIDHLCRNRGCVNPEHLEAVPLRTNVLRGDGVGVRNARKTHCANGHPFDEENTLPDERGWRVCKICRREQTRAANERRRRRLGQQPHDYEHCKRGHEWTPESTGIDHRGRRFCKTCKSDRAREQRGPAKEHVRPTHCPKGHEYTPENTYVHARGYYCRECNRAARRAAYAAKR
jgi:hypothetical protein